jgi:hypothetical protein
VKPDNKETSTQQDSALQFFYGSALYERFQKVIGCILFYINTIFNFMDFVYMTPKQIRFLGCTVCEINRMS